MTMLPSFAPLVHTLNAAGFDEIALRELLKTPDVFEILKSVMPSYLLRCQLSKEPMRARSSLFWLLHQHLPRALVEEMTGAPLLEWLLQQGLVTEHGSERIMPNVDISPCQGYTFFHDQRFQIGGMVPNRVYELGGDSYTLARLTPRKRARRALDLCTGSGIHAVMAAADHDEVIGVDLNPKALEFSRINAHLNGLGHKCEFLAGDLFEPVRGQTFDLITINPPFVSTPEKDMQIHRTGGETGEEISSRAVAQLPQFLRDGGTFSMVLSYPIMRDSTYLQRLNSWLGGGSQHAEGVPGWGILVVNTGSLDTQTYIRAHSRLPGRSDSDGAIYQQYLDSYQRLGIHRIGYANVFIRRLSATHRGFSAECFIDFPRSDLSASVEAYLQAQAVYNQPDWTPDWDHWRPRFSPELDAIWTNQRQDEGRLQPRPGSFVGPVTLQKPGLAFVSNLNGKNTAGRLAALWAQRNGVSLEEGRTAVKLRLACLGTNLFLELSSTDSPRFYRPELDGLRFIAFLLIFTYHSRLILFASFMMAPQWPRLSGWVRAADETTTFGVALFFVLSAYLLTRILVLEYEKSGRIDILSFWIRRGLRIWPLYFTFLLAQLALYPLSLLWPFLVFLGNWSMAAHGFPPGTYSHLWSISVEEQFYLTWPFLVLPLYRRPALALVLLAAAWSIRVGIVYQDPTYPAFTPVRSSGNYCETFAWVDCIVLGGLLAFRSLPPLSRAVRALLAVSGWGCWLVVTRYFFDASPTAANLVLAYFLVALGGSAILLATLGSNRGPLHHPAIVYLGRISYGLYVFHAPYCYWLQLHGGPYWGLNPISITLLVLVLTIVTAAISYQFLERPFLKLKRRFSHVASQPLP